jgi:hypothetical protein
VTDGLSVLEERKCDVEVEGGNGGGGRVEGGNGEDEREVLCDLPLVSVDDWFAREGV